MGFIADKIDQIKFSLENLSGNPEEDAITKGKNFEKTIFKLFSRDYFDCFDKNRDEFDATFQGSFRKNQAPFDFGFEYLKTHQRFYVECKYRSHFTEINGKNVLYVTKDKNQLEHYKETAKRLGLKVFLVVGVDGTPVKPKSIYCFPLDEVKYHTVYDYVCDRYIHAVDRNFYWKDGVLK